MANTGIFVFICTAVVFCIIGLIVPGPFYRFQTANERIISYGMDYLSVILSVSFFLFGQTCFERLLQATGRTNLAMIPQIVGATLNMRLDPIMVLGLFGCPKMEVRGAAIATVIGQLVATVIGLILNVRKNREINIDFKQIRPYKETIATIYRIGLPSIFMQAIG